MVKTLATYVGKKVEILDDEYGFFGTYPGMVQEAQDSEGMGYMYGYVTRLVRLSDGSTRLSVKYGKGSNDFDFYRENQVRLKENTLAPGSKVYLREGGITRYEDFWEGLLGTVDEVDFEDEAKVYFEYSNGVKDYDRVGVDQLKLAHGNYLPFGEMVVVNGLHESPAIFPGAVAVVVSRKREYKEKGYIELLSVNPHSGETQYTGVHFNNEEEGTLTSFPGNFLAPVSKEYFRKHSNNKVAMKRWSKISDGSIFD